MSVHMSRRLTTCAAISASLYATALAGPAFAATHPGFSGNAYGSTASTGSTAHSGKTAFVPLCTSKTGVSHSDTSAATPVQGLGTIGAVTTRVASKRPKKGTVESVSTTHTGTTTLAGGLIHATALDTRTSVSRSAKGYRHASTTTLTGLKIDGHSMPVHPTKNQSVSVPGVGHLVLNRQTSSSSHGAHTSAVTALILTTAANNTVGAPAGRYVIGSAVAALHKRVHHDAYGNAYGSTISGSDATAGRTAPVYVPCAGSDGHVSRNTTSGASKSGKLTTGDVTSTAVSTDKATATTTTTRSRITNANLLGGVITAKNITARAHVVRKGKSLSRSAAGTTIGHLTINGKTYAVTKPTKQVLSGIGTLYIDRTIKSKTGMQVYALELVLSQAQDGMAEGTTLITGAAKAGVRK